MSKVQLWTRTEVEGLRARREGRTMRLSAIRNQEFGSPVGRRTQNMCAFKPYALENTRATFSLNSQYPKTCKAPELVVPERKKLLPALVVHIRKLEVVGKKPVSMQRLSTACDLGTASECFQGVAEGLEPVSSRLKAWCELEAVPSPPKLWSLCEKPSAELHLAPPGTPTNVQNSGGDF
ncbi:hypothetical protein B0H17DRAFT_1151949 [Mycena rosella]|uniref:Uncharacterized protein n=1 Tax=Mycena rosella TaxID=1033263 RepID=A0AAD7BHA8_MYCRO|nr:hypothetical protein B0H17DRAFT_1151949 [Mycena rosella]